MKSKVILIAKPRRDKAGPIWPDQVTVQIRAYYVQDRRKRVRQYAVTGSSTLIEYNASTIVPLERAVLLNLTKQWREMFGRGCWDFYLKLEGHHAAPFEPRRNRIYWIPEISHDQPS